MHEMDASGKGLAGRSDRGSGTSTADAGQEIPQGEFFFEMKKKPKSWLFLKSDPEVILHLKSCSNKKAKILAFFEK